jgi:hypothetical protein
MKTGGYRPGAGRPRTKPRDPFPGVPAQVFMDARVAKMQPLEYMLAVMNDPNADPVRRDRMAIAAAPFCHPRVSDMQIGKKDKQAEAAETAGAGTSWVDDLEYEVRPS